jgi:hypothetical protein
MGLIKELALLPAAPLRFTFWVADKLNEEVQRQEYSPAAGVRKIEELEEKRERGEIDEEEAAEVEGEIIEQQVERAQPEPGDVVEPEEENRNGG